MSNLSETIERVAALIADADSESDADMVLCADLRTLLLAARRVQAMESVERPVIGRALNALDCDMARASDGVLFAQIQSADLRALLDLASDRDAQAAEVERLRADLHNISTEVRAERSRAEQAETEAEVERLRAKVEGYRSALWLCMDDVGGFLHPDGSAFIRGSGDIPNNFAAIYAQCEAGKEPRLSVLVSDTFAYACADSEDVEYPQASVLLAIARDEGWPGIIRWVQAQRQARGEETKPLAEVARRMSEHDQLRVRAEQAERERDEALELAMRDERLAKIARDDLRAEIVRLRELLTASQS